MQRRSPRRRLYGGVLRGLMYGSAVITCALLLFLIGYIFWRGLGHISWKLLSTQSSYLTDSIGILPNILNTLYIILVAMLLALPIGVGAAIYLTEYAQNRHLKRIIEFATETLTGIPSILFGLVGMLFFIQLLGLQQGILAGGLTLVVMILPTIIRTTQESLKTVPQAYREGALALGAGKWHTIRTVVLPNAVDGIVTGCILAIGQYRRRIGGATLYRGLRPRAERLRGIAAILIGDTDGRPVYLRQRAGRDGRGLCHCRDS